jgi:ABC-type sulfate/molybdate transport systems ATPase subunit
MKLIQSIILFVLFSFGVANAMTEKQMMIFHQVLNVDQGKVTKQMHTDFWSDVPDKDDVVNYMETTGLMAKITKDGMNYQKELWKSALISYQNNQVFKSNDYIKARDTMNDFINRVSKNIPDPNERQQVVMQMQVSMENSAELLRSAGARMNFQTVQGPIIEISEERLKFIIANLERSFVRIEKLLKPEWVD